MSSQSIRHKQREENGLSDSRDDHHEEQQHRDDIDLSKCCLAEEEIFTLARCGLKLSHYFRCARDIEWGIKEGQLFLFQSRPITGLDTMNDFELLHEFSMGLTGEIEWLSRANVGEVLPSAYPPLNMTYSLQFWSILVNSLQMKFGALNKNDWYPQRTNDLICVGYFNFFSMRFSQMFSFGSGKDRPLAARAFEIGIFGHEVDEPELAKSASELFHPNAWYVPKLVSYHSMPYRHFPYIMIDRARNSIRSLRRDISKHKFVETSSMIDLYKQLAFVITTMKSGLVCHMMGSRLSSEYNHKLTALLSKYIDEPLKLFSCSSKLLASHSDVFSARVPRHVNKMSQLIMAKGQEELNEFLAMNHMDSLKYITSQEVNRSELTLLFNKFMEEYGHRSYNEFDMSTERWRENPEVVIDMIKQSCQEQKTTITNSAKDSPSLECPNNTPKTRGSKLLRDMGIDLTMTDGLNLDYFILPKCHQFVDVRERSKDLMIYNHDCLRQGACVLAGEMRQQGRMPDEDLIYYMTYGELGRLVEQPEPTLVAQALRRRRFMKKMDSWKFEEIIKGHDFLPRHLTPDSEEAKQEKERLKLVPKILGTPASSGTISGKVCIVNDYSELNRVKSGDILVTYGTDIAFSPVFPIIGGIVTEIGGLISHGAVIAREYGIPTLIGIQNACSILKDGEQVMIDADNGYILRLELAP